MATYISTLNNTQKSVVDSLIDKLQSAGFNDYVIAAILGVISKERGFNTQPESCYNNTSNERIRKYHSRTQRLTDDQLNALKKNCKAFFDFVYDNRIGNGVGEGYLYRGRGLNQLTGKGNYRTFSKYTNVDLVKNPDAVTRIDVAVPVAVGFFKDVIAEGDKRYFLSRYGSTSKNVKDLTTAVKIANNANSGLGNNMNQSYWQNLDGYIKSANRAKEFLNYVLEKKNDIMPLQFSSIALIFIVLGTLYYSNKK
jgi:predicted chitinase